MDFIWFGQCRCTLLADLHMKYRSYNSHLYPMSDVSHPLVLCHMDLNMRNIIVDKGDVWSIDWGLAGTFPSWLDYANLVAFACAARKEWRLPKSWLFFYVFYCR
ncbi:hypothetical protein IW261DRAFT_1466424 [Armillaria novae-zelandiae]|uniref:Aminoglycoside phosphotransferase domain-containing protein n=1 Tax=Armillaria novae-zelandiae TaxID=153914 RepID=A0AA39PGZ7_9AGAR|nr:hypothetical protein IW261DRAFT_1466424 [Armillaria novae-zelandiae]